MRILLVEDDEDLRGRIAAVLRSENFVVDIARNGEDALHAGLTELFDVAILDLGLPGNGFGLSIVSELAGLYGGSLALEANGAVGLRSVLCLPVAAGSGR
ncbi:hypothetical protein B5P46_19255 [Rhizobium leguminosarum]|uniref:Response regulatory domain-containing protein n=1 Tax=Rhizobium leguminosarum TaxID=384 RepID=A0A4Q1TY98_RHILE|nr:response regulator [Rhizobium leguminosarum]RXT24054.1 hypothetical protein B5P46_19255 [Rhizobium leguminosarum]